jgi:hypothetical protein
MITERPEHCDYMGSTDRRLQTNDCLAICCRVVIFVFESFPFQDKLTRYKIRSTRWQVIYRVADLENLSYNARDKQAQQIWRQGTSLAVHPIPHLLCDTATLQRRQK